MSRYFILLLLLSASYFAFGQDTTEIKVYDIIKELSEPGEHNGNVRLAGDPSINNLLQLHIRANGKEKSFSGYRIQILSASSFGSDIKHLKDIRDKFEIAFPDIPAYLKYIDPDFKIRIGNFHTRLESIPTLYRIKKQYPSSYPVKTDILLEELKRIPMQDIQLQE